MNEPTPQGPTPQPKMSREEAEALIKSMEQEMVLQRAKREVAASGAPTTGTKWLLLIFALFVLLGILLAGFWYVNSQLRGTTPNPSAKPPTSIPTK